MRNTIVSKIETNKIDKKSLKEAVEILRRGGIIVYPTETCYGIGCDATNKKAVNDIYKIKKREKRKQMTIIVSSLNMIKKYGIITKKNERIIKKFMPGPLSIIVRKKDESFLSKNKDTLAFRISINKIANELVRKLKKPIISTSANITRKKPIYKINKIIRIFNKKVDMIINVGDLKKINPSTILDMTKNGIIIRHGPVSREEIMKELNKN